MKIFISDFDGTLCCTPESTLADREAINRFREKGNKFGIASGRSLSSLKILQEKNIPSDFLLANTTSVCTAESKIIFSQKIRSGIIPYLFECITKEGGLVFSITKEFEDFFIPTGDETYKMRGKEISLSSVEKLEYFSQVSTILPTTDAASRVVKKINKNFSDTLSSYQNGICIDIISKGWSKATGIAKLAELYSIDTQDIYTIGDNYNDILMLSAFNSFVVANAPAEIKRYASIGVVPTVADAIETLLKM